MNIFTGVVNSANVSRRQKQKWIIVKFLSSSDSALTIPEIARRVKISIPTATNLIADLIESSLIIESGKRESDNGRPPVLYSFNKNKFFTIGVEVSLKRLSVVFCRVDASVVYEANLKAFSLANDEASLGEMVRFIQDSIVASGIDYKQIIGIGLGITGRVNMVTGQSLSYFNFMDKPLKKYLNELFKLPVFIDNDTRVVGVAELVVGNAKNVKDALIVNFGRGLGLSIISGNALISGSVGYAGEFGHMQLGQLGRLCICGKKGCLETEVSGVALEEDLKIALERGDRSLYFDVESVDNYCYEDVLSAAKKGDALSIELLQKQGEKLGAALGSILNLLNPALIVICGEIGKLEEFLMDSIKLGMTKTSLPNPLRLCDIVSSSLEKDNSALGAASMVLRYYGMI